MSDRRAALQERLRAAREERELAELEREVAQEEAQIRTIRAETERIRSAPAPASSRPAPAAPASSQPAAPAPNSRRQRQRQRRQGLDRVAPSQRQPQPLQPAEPAITFTNRRVLRQDGPLRRVQFEADKQVLHAGSIAEMAKAVMRAVTAERLIKPAARLVFESSVNDTSTNDITFSEARGQMTEAKVAELLHDALDNKIATNSEGDWLLVRFEIFGGVRN